MRERQGQTPCRGTSRANCCTRLVHIITPFLLLTLLIPDARPVVTLTPAHILHVTTIGWTGGTGAVYVANNSGLFRSLATPYLSWTQQSRRTAIVSISPNPRKTDDLLYEVCCSYGAPLYRSTDGGHTAVRVSRAFGGLVRALGAPTTIYGEDGNADGGAFIMRSTDDGVIWTQVYTAPDIGTTGPSINDIVVDRADPQHVVAAVELYHGGYLIASQDGGTTWRQLPAYPSNTGPLATAPTLVEISPSQRGRLWVAIHEDATAGETLYQTVDGGRTWRACTGLPSGLSIITIADDGRTGDVYVTGDIYLQPTTLYLSTNGQRFRQINVPGMRVPAAQLLLSADGRYALMGDYGMPFTVVRVADDGHLYPLSGLRVGGTTTASHRTDGTGVAVS